MKKSHVDYIHEYLLLKGIEAVGIHGDKSQNDRYLSLDNFKKGLKDVLVATDVASKGLDFPEIQHVINFDMPPDIECYVHRIGRTGRNKKIGLATTLITKSCDGPVLLDLKHLLIEAKQKLPDFMLKLKDHDSLNQFFEIDSHGCSYCGGLGHRITECTKLEIIKTKKIKKLEKKEFNSTRNNNDYNDW